MTYVEFIFCERMMRRLKFWSGTPKEKRDTIVISCDFPKIWELINACLDVPLRKHEYRHIPVWHKAQKIIDGFMGEFIDSLKKKYGVE